MEDYWKSHDRKCHSTKNDYVFLFSLPHEQYFHQNHLRGFEGSVSSTYGLYFNWKFMMRKHSIKIFEINLCWSVENNSMHFHLIKESMKRLIAREQKNTNTQIYIFFRIFFFVPFKLCSCTCCGLQFNTLWCIIRLISLISQLKIKSPNKLWMNLKWFALCTLLFAVFSRQFPLFSRFHLVGIPNEKLHSTRWIDVRLFVLS